MPFPRAKTIQAGVAALILLGSVGTSLADTRGRLRATFHSWSWDEQGVGKTTLDQLTTRLIVSTRLHSRLEMEMAAGWAGAKWDGVKAADVSDRINGLLDTKLRFMFRAQDRLMLRLGINIPTGTSKFSGTEAPLATALSTRIFLLDGNRMGEGAGLDLGASYVFPLGDVALGVGIGYFVRGKFDPLTELSDFAPGNQLSLGLGADLNTENWLIRGNTRFVGYTDATASDIAFYRLGNRAELQGTLLRRFPRSSIWGNVMVIVFGKARALDDAGNLSAEELRSRGTETYVDLGANRVLSSKVSLKLLLGGRFFAASERNEGKAHRLTATAGIRTKLTHRLALDFDLGLGTGSLDQPIPGLGNTQPADLSGYTLLVQLTQDF